MEQAKGSFIEKRIKIQEKEVEHAENSSVRATELAKKEIEKDKENYAIKYKFMNLVAYCLFFLALTFLVFIGWLAYFEKDLVDKLIDNVFELFKYLLGAVLGYAVRIITEKKNDKP